MSMSVGSNNPLSSALQAKGLSSKTIEVIQEDLKEVLEEASGSGATASAASVREQIDAKLAEDVASGEISAEDAAAVTQVLDEADAAAASAASGGGAAQGGGGGGGSSEKTEVSRSSTVTANIKTTVITYSDQSTETKTSVATEADKARDGASEDSAAAQMVKDYLAKIAPGSLFDAYA